MQTIDTVETEKFLPARRVRQRYGSISSMTLGRWLADADLNFPKPFYLGRLRFWRLADLVAWKTAQDRRPDPTRCVVPRQRGRRKVTPSQFSASEAV